MYRYNRLGIKGFRRLFDIDLPLAPLNVVIGANGSGKTSLLDVFSLLAASAAGTLNERFNALHGMSANLTRGRIGEMSFEFDAESAEGTIRNYRLGFVSSLFSYSIHEESLRVLTTNGVGSWEETPLPELGSDSNPSNYSPLLQMLGPQEAATKLESSLSRVSEPSGPVAEFRNHLSSLVYYHALDVSPRAPVRMPQPLRPVYLPGANGEDLISCLYTMRETNPDRFEIVEDSIRAVFPEFQKFEFPPVAAGMLSMAWRDKNLSQPIYSHELSEGTLRFLWLVTLLQSPDLPDLTLIDEPEVSLHPELLGYLVDLFREASTRTQLVIATHSDRLVRFCRPEEVIVLDIGDDGFVSATPADRMNLDEWLKEYTMDEIWQIGQLGGRS